ncbi:MAG: hypothetical protein Salg2KO_11160 [Salibacteraceae bacterium]
MRILLTLFITLFFGSNVLVAENLDYTIVWEDRFSKEEKVKVEQWLGQVSAGVFGLLGKYPFTVNYYIHRKDGAREPVPWANTVRDGEEGVHFHINPDFSLNDFLADWTAPHEISHLAIPYVGRENMWFSEGYASYLQYLVMAEMGVITKAEADLRIKERIQRIQSDYRVEVGFLQRSNQLRKQHNYPAVYWGGACFFMEANQKLGTDHETSLPDVVRAYQTQYRLAYTNLDALSDLIQHLDEVSNTRVFTNIYQVFQEQSADKAVGSRKLIDKN